jgi:TonB family protein
MTYWKDLPAKPLPGREYYIRVGEITGTTRFYVAKESVYVLMVLDNPGDVWATERFFQSFSVKPEITTLVSDPVQIGPGRRGETDDNDQVFSSRETTRKIRLLFRPAPSYTESARKYSVTGTVILRAVFSKSGQVEKIYVLRKLPHGLTEAAITAARGIKFEPAQKDGQAVSQYLQLEYNFNLY